MWGSSCCNYQAGENAQAAAGCSSRGVIPKRVGKVSRDYQLPSAGPTNAGSPRAFRTGAERRSLLAAPIHGPCAPRGTCCCGKSEQCAAWPPAPEGRKVPSCSPGSSLWNVIRKVPVVELRAASGQSDLDRLAAAPSGFSPSKDNKKPKKTSARPE